MSANEENKILNEKEANLLLDHNYDGIQEFDYPLPSWWTWTFVLGIVFAIFYIYYLQVANGPTIKDGFNKDMIAINKIRAEQALLTGNFDLGKYQTWKAGADFKKQGLEVFEENCLSCHEEKGKGDIGPNLTDKYWIHLKTITPATVYGMINRGMEDNGMPAWGETISKEEMYAATSYVMSIINTNVEGKEPQGEEVKN